MVGTCFLHRYKNWRDDLLGILSLQRMQKAVTVVRPKTPGPCSWKSIRTADTHTSPAETPQSHFCRARCTRMMGYKTNVPHTSPPFALLLVPWRPCYLCQNTQRRSLPWLCLEVIRVRAAGCAHWPKPRGQGTACSWCLSHPQLHKGFFRAREPIVGG